MFENPRRGRQAEKFYNKCSENSRSQIVFRTDIFRKLSLGAPVFMDLDEVDVNKNKNAKKNERRPKKKLNSCGTNAGN